MKIHKIIGIIVVILILFLVVVQLSTMVSCEERVKEGAGVGLTPIVFTFR